MIADNLILIEIVFGAAVVFGFGFYQLWSLKREARKDAEGKQNPPDSKSAARPGHPVGEHELDDR